jgi:hypothetical protein
MAVVSADQVSCSYGYPMANERGGVGASSECLEANKYLDFAMYGS